MDTPASAARRIIFGTGLGLLIISGLLFTMGLLPPTRCSSEQLNCISTNSFGWLIPIFGLLFIIIGILSYNNPNLFGNLIPNSSEIERRDSLEKDIIQEQLEDSKSSNAWSSLEKKLLINKIEEE